MGDIVNLKLHRKRKARAASEDQAAENRASFGRTKTERELTDAQKKKADEALNGHKRER